MANSRRKAISYTPRMTSYEAYDKLGPKIRRALQEAVTEWNAYWCYRQFQKYGADRVVAAIRAGDAAFVAKGFIPKHGFRKGLPSTVVACDVPILRANWEMPS